MSNYDDNSWYEMDDIDNAWLSGDDDASGSWVNPPGYNDEDE